MYVGRNLLEFVSDFALGITDSGYWESMEINEVFWYRDVESLSSD